MKSTNKIFLILILGLFAITFVSWRIIQTERVGSLLSSHVSKIASEQIGVELKFDKVELELFPISTTLINTKIKKDDYNLEAGEVALEFGLRDLFAKTFSIGRIVITESEIKIPKIESTEKKSEKFDLKSYFEKYQQLAFDELPIRLRALKLQNSNIILNKSKSRVYSLEVNLYKNIITTDISVFTQKKVIKDLVGDGYNIPDLDGLDASVQITKDEIRVKNIKVFSETSYVSASTTLDNEGEIQKGKVSGFLEMKKVEKFLPKGVVSEDLLPSGGIEFNINFDELSKTPILNGSFKGKKLYSNSYRFEEIRGSFKSDGKDLSFGEIEGEIQTGKIAVNDFFKIYNWEDKEVISPRLNLRVDELYSNHFLFFLEGLNSAKFNLSGDLGVQFYDKGVFVTAKDNVTLSDFKLKAPRNDELIVGNKKIKLKNKGLIDIRFDGQVNIDTTAFFKKSKLVLNGFVNGKEVKVNVNNSWIDFEELGPIVGTPIIGRGKIDGAVIGSLDNVMFDLNMEQDNFEVINFNFGTIRGAMKYLLAENTMMLRNIRGNYKSIKYLAGGDLVFDKNKKDQLDLKINISKGTLSDARVAFAPIFDPLEKYTKDVNFNFKSKLSLNGKMAVDRMSVKGSLSATSLMVKSEDIDSASVNFTLKENKLDFKNIKAKKVSGSLLGEAAYHLGKKEYSYRFSLSSLRLKDVLYYRLMNLGLDGELYGEFNGVGDEGSFSSRSHIKVRNSSIENYKLSDSVLTVYNNNSDLFFSGAIIGGDASTEGYLNLDQSNSKKLSSITTEIKSENIKVLTGMFSEHNIFNKDINGIIEAKVQTDFNIYEKQSLDLLASLDKAEFNYTGIDFKLEGKPVTLKINRGKFVDWDFNLVGDGVKISSHGTGDINDEFKLVNKFEVNSSILELVNERVQKSYGILKGEHVIIGSDKVKNFIKVGGDDLSLKAKDLPGLITDIDLDVSMDNNKIILNALKGKYGNGEVLGRGVIKLKLPFPEIDLKLSIEKARYPLFKKSGLVISGDLSFKGERLPYDLSGDLAIINGEIIEETNDLASSAINNDSYQRYIPVGYLEGNVSFMKNDIRIVGFDPIKIKNSMMDLGLLGNMNIFGTMTNPKFKGNLKLSNNENKFLFKGHEFLLSEGVIHFVDGARKESPELRFSGTAKINEFDVFVNLTGPADSLVVEMSSNPPLIQEDILSLLTLGVTSDVSKNLHERQRQSVTTLSIGSLIMDQLKINQSLNDSLGLRLSVQPEFEEDETTLLEGKVDDGTNNSRLRSATVVKVQKKINKDVNLSVSSTVGGNIDQSQEMNINYKINKSWSLEGVYEVKSNDELEQQIPDSVGADVKYQWSF